ncbi:MAG: DUF1365 domain-containing protein, partial [Pseudomonadota bacterium]
MGIVTPSLLHARVMHKRLMPKQNSFHYGVYYLSVPLSMLEDGSLDAHIPLNRFGLHSFYVKDHGPRDGSSLRVWAHKILAQYDIAGVKHITLICMPRILGYVFNPVSFWLCLDDAQNTKAVICEVNNTFGETHSYVCVHKDACAITKNSRMHAKKLFHVSPFIVREGGYDFRFDITKKHCGIQINYKNAFDQTLLLTSLKGKFQSLSRKALLRAFTVHPLVTFKVIMMINYQALKLVRKKICYIPKPMQQVEK